MVGIGNPSRLRRGALGAASLVIASFGPVAASAAVSHDPVGAVTNVHHAGQDVTFDGWAADPDARHRRASIITLVDGHRRGTTRTSVALPHLAARKDLNARPGFSVTAAVPADGVSHTVCVAVGNIGPGSTQVLHCALTPRSPRTAEVVGAHSPRGRITFAHLHHGWLHVYGWTVDPDFLSGRSTVVIYVNGVPRQTLLTGASTSAEQRAGAGPRSRFAFAVPVNRGSSVGCVWSVDVGVGTNTLIGCHAADTRRAGHGKVHESAANHKVVHEARRHLGGKYVWGAEGPKKFDCSGLVQYAYGKAHRAVPRIAADQFSAAHLISAKRAVPGDLVFYHTGLGYVHHVGIYLRPGMSIAAIDPAEGIDYQPIYPDSGATYGSFTHR